jgi:hypothetical protein
MKAIASSQTPTDPKAFLPFPVSPYHTTQAIQTLYLQLYKNRGIGSSQRMTSYGNARKWEIKVL